MFAIKILVQHDDGEAQTKGGSQQEEDCVVQNTCGRVKEVFVRQLTEQNHQHNNDLAVQKWL